MEKKQLAPEAPEEKKGVSPFFWLFLGLNVIMAIMVLYKVFFTK